MNEELRHNVGSVAYATICNDEGMDVCNEFAEDHGMTPDEMWDMYCGESADVDWPQNGTEDEIRAASRREWLLKIGEAR